MAAEQTVFDQSGKFWKQNSLEALSQEEWESLCDGCGLCCLIKLEDEENDEVYYTRILCRYLDEATSHCHCYADRSQRVPDCVSLTPEKAREFHWLPVTCAYRLCAEGKDLPGWHHLVSGSRTTVHEEGISVKGKALSEEFVHPQSYDEHIIRWVEY
ncbi:MAG: YcgN family cysteine cluster protein [Gammaproteobacteria bacterium]|nr:YcgN family cysteine cluster protein [Gammaproteobacteria bacterium]